MLVDSDDIKEIYHLDPAKTWEQQKSAVTSKVIPALRAVLGHRYRYNDSEACDIIKRLHRSCHRVYNISQVDERAKQDKRHKNGNTKRADVRTMV